MKRLTCNYEVVVTRWFDSRLGHCDVVTRLLAWVIVCGHVNRLSI